MKYLLLFSFYICTSQSLGQQVLISVDEQILQSKIQPAFDALNSVKDANIRSIRSGRTSQQSNAEKTEQHRGQYCNVTPLAENFNNRVTKLCGLEDTIIQCSSAKDQTKINIGQAANIITSTTGVLDTLYKTRDQVNEVLSNTISSNKICLDKINNNLLSDSCLRSFDIVLNPKDIDTLSNHCTTQQVNELKEYISQILGEMGSYLTRIREDYFKQREAEVQIFNMIVRIEESISQLEVKQRQPTSDPIKE